MRHLASRRPAVESSNNGHGGNRALHQAPEDRRASSRLGQQRVVRTETRAIGLRRATG